jgi:hypothetical protein
VIIGDRCRNPAPTYGEPAEGTPAVTIRDIASFRPTSAVHRMEPNGWAVVGLPTNFYAAVGQQIRTGTLLGRPASVRFTPVAFHWDYGDGAGASRSTGGGTWAALGIPEFEATPTSHVYTREGDYVIRLVVDFAAEYRFDDGAFIPISGRLSLPANELTISADGAKTVLVEQDCLANPSGPGC